jgi:hypothetical protein
MHLELSEANGSFHDVRATSAGWLAELLYSNVPAINKKRPT